MIDELELGNRLKFARESIQMTQEAVAKELGLNRSAISQIETGERAITSLELDRLSSLYGKDIRDFFKTSFVEGDALAALFRANPDVIRNTSVRSSLRFCLSIFREQSNLESLLDIDRTFPAAAYPVHAPNKKTEAIRQGERTAEEERKRLSLGIAPIGNLPELLDKEGIHIQEVEMDDDVSGFTMNDKSIGPFIVINASHANTRKRYSYSHEYAHVLMDRHTLNTVSRTSDHANLIEVRANSFAAAFLLPEGGVRQFLATLGKDKVARTRAEVFDGISSVPVEFRTSAEARIKLYDVLQLAHYFGVSKVAVLFRLLNLRLINQAEHKDLVSQDTEIGPALLRLLGLKESREGAPREDTMTRFLALALEALRREEISMSKFRELAEMAGLDKQEIRKLVSTALQESKVPKET